jgi:hypothetical protein
LRSNFRVVRAEGIFPNHEVVIGDINSFQSCNWIKEMIIAHLRAFLYHFIMERNDGEIYPGRWLEKGDSAPVEEHRAD